MYALFESCVDDKIDAPDSVVKINYTFLYYAIESSAY